MNSPREVLAENIGWSQLLPPNTRLSELGFIDPERIRSSAVVLTGPNSCGKTSLTEILAERGLEIVPEMLRESYDIGKAVFGDYRVPRKYGDIVVESSLSRHIRYLSGASASTHSDSRIVCDRGLGDFIGFMRLIKLLVNPLVSKTFLKQLLRDQDIRDVLGEDHNFREIEQSCDRQIRTAFEWSRLVKYRAVLGLQALPFIEDDGIRSTDRMTINTMALFTAKAWKDLGYRVIPVPCFTGNIQGRADYLMRLAFGEGRTDVA